MDEFVDNMEDWSLQAIVRESSGDFSKIFDTESESVFGFSGLFDREFMASFPELFDVEKGSSIGLEELYKPFYPLSEFPHVEEQQIKENVDEKINHIESDQSLGTGCGDTRVTAAYTPRYKRRKNQHKRVVIQVSVEDLTTDDKWAWRKYGQKPIKGSPYPRSYYRCSSSRGCLARKQIEQSCADPGMFIITYTAEHDHNQPTRRNSLAGTIRQKFQSLKSPNTAQVKKEKAEESNSSNDSQKNFSRVSSSEIDYPQNQSIIIKHEENEARLFAGESYNDNDFIMSDALVFNDEFFSGLEDLDEFILEQAISCTTVSCS